MIAGAYFEDIPELKIPKEMSELAGHIIDTKKGKFDPSSFEDRYEDAMVEARVPTNVIKRLRFIDVG